MCRYKILKINSHLFLGDLDFLSSEEKFVKVLRISHLNEFIFSLLPSGVILVYAWKNLFLCLHQEMRDKLVQFHHEIPTLSREESIPLVKIVLLILFYLFYLQECLGELVKRSLCHIFNFNNLMWCKVWLIVRCVVSRPSTFIATLCVISLIHSLCRCLLMQLYATLADGSVTLFAVVLAGRWVIHAL